MLHHSTCAGNIIVKFLVYNYQTIKKNRRLITDESAVQTSSRIFYSPAKADVFCCSISICSPSLFKK